MITAAEIHEAFNKVDELLERAGEVAPAVALLLERARQQGVSEHQLASHLHITTAVLRWVLRVKPDATADRIDLEAADDDIAELVLRWARQ